jgi:hypothetical protein
MRVSALEIVLGTERVRQQTAVKTKAGFSRPVLCERAVDPTEGPFLATNMRGSFLTTSRSKDGAARFAFTECPVASEGKLISELYAVLWRTSVQQDWSNRCISMSQAKARMEALGVQPKVFIVGPSFLGDELTEEDAEKLMLLKGCIAEVEGLKVLAADLPPGQALLATSKVGSYVRSGDYLGVLVCQANRSLVLVGDE